MVMSTIASIMFFILYSISFFFSKQKDIHFKNLKVDAGSEEAVNRQPRRF